MQKTIRFMGYVLYIFLQCTWGILQTFLGLILFFIFFTKPHDFYHGSIRTKWDTFNGISLGLFIFTPNEENETFLKYTHNSKEVLVDRCRRISVHEYGHTFQSLILGPLYLFIVGLPSLAWSRLKRYKKLRKEYGVPYSFFWPEHWANDLGEKVLKQPSIK